MSEGWSGTPLLVLRIDHRKVLFKSPALPHDTPLGVKNEARPVENQLVIGPDLIHENDASPVFPRDAPEHIRPQPALPVMVRRGQKVDDQLGPPGHQLFQRIGLVPPTIPVIFVVPYVFTNGDAQLLAQEKQRLPRHSRLEIPAFVKYVVVGQETLILPPDQAPAVKEKGRVVKAFARRVPHGSADEDAYAQACREDLPL